LTPPIFGINRKICSSFGEIPCTVVSELGSISRISVSTENFTNKFKIFRTILFGQIFQTKFSDKFLYVCTQILYKFS
jgi:hypothetical protein